MGISNFRTIEARRNSDEFHTFTLETPEDDELARGHDLALTFHHDDGDESIVLLGVEETHLLIAALEEWAYGA